MSAIIIHDPAAADSDLARRIFAELQESRAASLRHVRIEAHNGAIVLRGEVNSFYAKQVLQHSARRAAGDKPVVDELSVVTPAALRDPRRLRSTAVAGALLLLASLVTGCGSSEPPRPPVFPVSGQVMVNGRPGAGAYVVFHPKATESGIPSPQAYADKQGKFAVGTFSQQDGAPVGEYAVTVVLEPMVKVGDEFERGKNVLPPKYSNPTTTTVVARVAEGANTVPIKIVR